MRVAWTLLTASVLAFCALIFAHWPWVDAQARAAVVLVSVVEAPAATPFVEAFTGEPRVRETAVAGNPASVFVPAGEGPYPAVVFVNGTIPQGRRYEGVRDLATGLARAGYLTVVPDLPGLTTDTVTVRTLSETVEVAREVSERPEARGGSVGLIGVSTGGTLALLAAEDRSLEGRVSAVVGVAPYTDIRTVLSIATTGHYERDDEMEPYRADPFLSYVVGRSVISALPPGEDRRTLLSALETEGRASGDPLAPLRRLPRDELGSEAVRVAALLANRDPGRFERLYRALPEGVKAKMRMLSPVHGAEKIEAPVELVTGPQDKYFPPSESYELERVAPERAVTVTEVLDHSEVRLSLRALGDFMELNAFAFRSLEKLRGERS